VHRLSQIWHVIGEAFSDWQEDGASRLAAALAYYAVFSLAPTVIIAVSVAGYILGQGRAEQEVLSQVETWLQSEEASRQVERILINARQAGSTGTIVGIGGLVFGATVFFASLQDALNIIWEVKPKGRGPILGFLKKRAISFLMIIGLGALVIASLVSSTVLTALGGYFEDVVPLPTGWLQLANLLVSFVLITVLFGAVYKILPDARIAWSDIWIGAGITSFLFVVGAFGLSVYFAFSSVGSAYGAAGTLIVIIVWIYWSSQIILFGAEVTQVYANRFGRSIVPEEGAEYRPGAHRSRQVKRRPELAEGDTPDERREAAKREALHREHQSGREREAVHEPENRLKSRRQDRVQVGRNNRADRSAGRRTGSVLLTMAAGGLVAELARRTIVRMRR